MSEHWRWYRVTVQRNVTVRAQSEIDARRMAAEAQWGELVITPHGSYTPVSSRRLDDYDVMVVGCVHEDDDE